MISQNFDNPSNINTYYEVDYLVANGLGAIDANAYVSVDTDHGTLLMRLGQPYPFRIGVLRISSVHGFGGVASPTLTIVSGGAQCQLL